MLDMYFLLHISHLQASKHPDRPCGCRFQANLHVSSYRSEGLVFVLLSILLPKMTSVAKHSQPTCMYLLLLLEWTVCLREEKAVLSRREFRVFHIHAALLLCAAYCKVRTKAKPLSVLISEMLRQVQGLECNFHTSGTRLLGTALRSNSLSSDDGSCLINVH